jgi:hypothetical protein
MLKVSWLVDVMEQDSGIQLGELRVDGRGTQRP